MTPMTKHLESMQVKASNLQYVLGAIRALEGEKDGEFSDERVGLEDVAYGMARDLNAGLDIVKPAERKGSSGMSTGPTYREAHDATSLPLSRAKDLLYALYDLATDHPALNTPEPGASAIISMIACAEEKVAAALEAHEAEWDAATRIPERH